LHLLDVTTKERRIQRPGGYGPCLRFYLGTPLARTGTTIMV